MPRRIPAIGMLTAGYVGRLAIRAGEGVLADQSQAFREVFLIEYPRRGIWALGFITGPTQGEVRNLAAGDVVNVFVPTTPNPTSGFQPFFARSDIRVLNMTTEEGIKMVVAGGIVTPPGPPPAGGDPPAGIGGPGFSLPAPGPQPRAAAGR